MQIALDIIQIGLDVVIIVCLVKSMNKLKKTLKGDI